MTVDTWDWYLVDLMRDARDAGADGASLPSPTENEAYLADRFRREVLATGAD